MQQIEAINNLIRIKKDYETRKNYFTISFCGVFSSGKSSILNYFLDYDEFKLPVGNFPVTKVVTRIQYGEILKFYCITENTLNYEEKCEEISRDEFEQMVVGKLNLPFNCREILIKIPSSFLKNGIVLLDTPGFLDEMGGELEKMSRDAVLRSDLVIVCTSAINLGHQFEREFIEELDNCIGNYCMIVNKMDCCNTDEDVEDIKEKAKFLMTDKGGMILNNLFGRSYFFSIAFGIYQTMNNFDEYLNDYVLKDMELREEIHKTSSEKIKKFQVTKIMDQINLEVMILKEEYETVEKDHLDKLQQIRTENILIKIENEEKQHAFKEKYFAKIDTANLHMRTIIPTFGAVNFTKKVTSELIDTYTKIINNAELELSNITHSNSHNIKRIISKFIIPAPFKEKKYKLGFFDKIRNEFSDSVEDRTIGDDGWVYDYNNYEEVAIKVIMQQLKPKLEDAIQYMSSSAHFVEFIPEYTGFEKKMDDLKDEMNDWKKVKQCCKSVE